jgi:hypothetical protein
VRFSVQRVTRGTVAAIGLAAVAALAAPAQPASAATYVGYIQGSCLQAQGTAFRLQLKIPVTELPGTTGSSRLATAYMTMNVEWCSNGTNITYAVIQSSNADRTAGGAASGLERRSYTKSGTPPTYVGGPYTLKTAATWGRTTEATISGQPFGIGGSVTFKPANFTSTMTVNVYPTEARVTCTGTSGGNAEPCQLNY